jgi:hypothetical protein
VDSKSIGTKKPFSWTCEEPVDNAFVQGSCASLEPVLTAIKSFQVELLAGFNAVPLPQFGGQHDLTFRRNRCFHAVPYAAGV